MGAKVWMVGVGLLGLAVGCGGGVEGGVASVPPTGSGAAAVGSVEPRPAPLASAPEVGSYKAPGGTLDVREIGGERLTFSLVFVMPTEGAHHADLEGAVAEKKASGDYVFAPDPDCTISLRPDGVGVLVVKQTGTCSSQGFGAYVQVDGRYARK